MGGVGRAGAGTGAGAGAGGTSHRQGARRLTHGQGARRGGAVSSLEVVDPESQRHRLAAQFVDRCPQILNCHLILLLTIG